MRIFPAKKEKEEYEEELEITKRKLPKDKNFKDLKAGNRKKRAEPPKPWTKR
jgi:hypothetical protein